MCVQSSPTEIRPTTGSPPTEARRRSPRLTPDPPRRHSHPNSRIRGNLMPRLNAESIRRKREQLEAELEALRSKERSAADERNAIAGRALLDHALTDHAFAEEVRRILDRKLTKRSERALF